MSALCNVRGAWGDNHVSSGGSQLGHYAIDPLGADPHQIPTINMSIVLTRIQSDLTGMT